MASGLFGFVVVCFYVLNFQVLADRTSLKIYEKIQSDIFCFRRLNASHQIGCASDRSGNIGVVHVVNDYEGIKSIAEDPPYGPTIVALPIYLFNMGNMTLLKDSKDIKGVLILKEENEPPPESFSPEQSCPNRNFGFYTDEVNKTYSNCEKVQWNDIPENLASGMMYEDWGMPIFLVTNETSIQRIKKCYELFNKPENGTLRQWPLCSAELKSVMWAAKDSETCMRRSKLITSLTEVKTCDPLSDKNVLTTLFPTNKSEEIANRSVVVVAARLDAFSLFDRLAPGAHSAVTGLVTFLTVAHTMAQIRDEVLEHMNFRNLTNILFIIFNGEAFDYIGSSRVVFDMQKGVFPIEPAKNIEQPATLNLDHISHFIELSQLAPDSANNTYWVHTDPISIAKNVEVSHQVTELYTKLHEEARKLSLQVKRAPPTNPLPPASFQRFLRHDSGIPGIVIADHKEIFVNRYYNSFFDTKEALNITLLSPQLTSLSSAISRMLYQLLTGKTSDNCTSNETLVEGLLECYLKNASCDLFREIANPAKTEHLRVEPYPLYVSVNSGGHTNAITIYTRYLLAYLTGYVLDNHTKETCVGAPNNQIYQFDWMAGSDSSSSGICLKSTVMYSIAQSPAYVLNEWKSSEYSTWTESVWLETTVRIFLQPSTTQETITLVTGVAIFLLSIGAVYFVNKRASIIFNTRPLVGC